MTLAGLCDILLLSGEGNDLKERKGTEMKKNIQAVIGGILVVLAAVIGFTVAIPVSLVKWVKQKI